MRANTDKIVKGYVLGLMPKRLQKSAGHALHELYYGPSGSGEGFLSATRKLQTWIRDEMPSELWVDTQSDFVLDSEPEGYTDEETGEYQEPLWEDYVHYDRRAILRAAFGELAENL